MFLTPDQISKLGFKKVGKNVLISEKTSIYFPENIIIGDNVRIDDYCVISPGTSLVIGNHVHIACFCSIIGKGHITLRDFAGLSSRVSLYSSSDDYSGSYLTNPTIPDDFKKVIVDEVYVGKHCIIGSGCVILPGSIIGEGTAVGAMSLVSYNLEPWGIYAGAPCRRLKDRNKDMLQLEIKFKNSIKNGR